jgi:uncharacterized integral membrane protein (TIGR00697 family)
MLSNELLWLLMLVANFAIILVLYRTLGKLGLYVWIPVAVIVANIQVVKYVELLGFTATLGNIVYASSFLVTDILSENHGRKSANRAVLIGFVALIATVGLMNLALVFPPGAADSSQEHLFAIFSLLPRITGASLAAYFVSQFHDVWAYHFWMRRVPGRRSIWLRNNASTIVSQFLDTAVFTFLAFVGTVSWGVLFEIFVTTFVVKAAVAVLDTPLVYLAARWKNRAEEIDEQFA